MSEIAASEFKYNHGDRLPLTQQHKRWAWWALAIGALLLITPIGIFIIVAAGGYLLWGSTASAGLIISQRHFICGEKIWYYHNLQKIVLSADLCLTIYHQNGQKLIIKSSLFPSNARKDLKIKRHQGSKFGKAADKLISKALSAAPELEVVSYRNWDHPGATR